MATYNIRPKTGTTAEWLASENSLSRVFDLHELLVEECADGFVKMKQGDGIHTWSNLPYIYDQHDAATAIAKAAEASTSAEKAAASNVAVDALVKAANDAMQATIEAKAAAVLAQESAAQSALVAAGYEGNTQFGLVPNADGSVSLVFKDTTES